MKLKKFLKDNTMTVVAFVAFFVLLGLKLSHHLRDFSWWVVTIPIWVELMTRMF